MIGGATTTLSSSQLPMRASVVSFAVSVMLATASGCALHHAEEADRRADRSILTQQQIAARHFNTVYDAVESLRSNWLHARGTDSFQNPSEVRVYLDNTLLGGTDKLREIAAKDVTFIKYFDGVAATARWGVGHAAGVIYLSTHPQTGDPEAAAHGAALRRTH